jgi:hypothetical protein
MIDYVLLPTIQHTGTWFLLDILQKAKMTTVPYNPEWTQKNTVLHAHFPLSVGNGILPQEENKFISLDGIKWAINNFENNAIVVPIRDPLAAVITRQNRHPEMPHKYIIDGFLSFAQDFNDFNVLWFPVDLYTSKNDKLALLEKLENHIDRTILYKHTLATEWQQKNTSGMYTLKEAYLENNVKEIKQNIPCEWEQLINIRSLLKPFFQALGYKNLTWFEDEND